MIKVPKPFEVLLESINAQIEVLNKNGYKIFDAENSEFFISKIQYNQEDDQIKFYTEGDTHE